MIKLDKMNLNELDFLQYMLKSLVAAGRTLVDCGLDPVFDMTPGHEITIRTGHKMPVCGPQLPPIYYGLDFGNGDYDATTEYPEGAKPAKTGAGPQAPAGESAGGGARVTTAPGGEDEQNLAEAAPGDAGAEGEGTAPPREEVPAKSPGVGEGAASAGALTTGSLTVEEKNTILDLAGNGWTRPNIAKFICRKVQTVALFLSQHEKITSQPDPGPVAEQTGGPKTSPAGGGEAGRIEGHGVAVPAPEAPKADPVAPKAAPAGDGLAAHLAGLSRRNGWTLERDAELMRLACLGWAINEIEADLGVQGAKARFELLTDSRCYPREKVAAQLAAMLPKKA